MPVFVPYEFPRTKDGQFIAFQSDDRIFFSRRQQLNMTQHELAERAGVPLRQIQRLEAGTSDIRNCPMDTALSICAALLLDPYQFIHINKQPDPDSLSPLPPLEDFSMEDPFHRKKKAGRKPIRRDVMTVFFRSPVFSVMIPRHVLEAIGSPTALDILWKKGDNRLLFQGNNNSGFFDIPDELYTDASYLVFPSSPIVEEISERLNWDEFTYAVECRIVKNSDKKIFILCDLGTALEADPEDGTVVVPHRCNQIYEDDYNGDQDK